MVYYWATALPAVGCIGVNAQQLTPDKFCAVVCYSRLSVEFLVKDQGKP